MKVDDLEVLASEVHGEGGFARLRRVRVRNVRQDGSRSSPYIVDIVERPGSPDAVTAVAYSRGPGAQVRVLLREGLRPVPRLGRSGLPTREGERPGLVFVEATAGILEPGDLGTGGLRQRVAEELWEETGLRVDPQKVEQLGPPVYVSAGLMAERIYFCSVQADLAAAGTAGGDGSPMEEGSAAVILDLEQALALCRQGRIQDAKTELALRRLAEHLRVRDPRNP